MRVFLTAFSFLCLQRAGAQALRNITGATASANIVTEMIGTEKMEDISFTAVSQDGIFTAVSANASLTIIGNEYSHSITVPSEVIPFKKEGSEGSLQAGNFEFVKMVGAEHWSLTLNATLIGHYAELSFREIARITGCSVNTSLGRMRYGLINLRKMMKENLVEM